MRLQNMCVYLLHDVLKKACYIYHMQLTDPSYSTKYKIIHDHTHLPSDLA